MSGGNSILTGALVVVALAQFAATMTSFGQEIASVNSPKMPDGIIKTQIAIAAVSTFTDTFLGVVMIRLLRKARSGFKNSDSIVNRLVTYVVASSSITAVCMLVALIASSVAPHTLIYLPSDFLIVKRQRLVFAPVVY